MGVPLLDLVAQYETMREEIAEAVDRVLAGQRFILGEEVAALEREVAEKLGAAHAIGVASGTDALLLALRGAGVGRGDEVLLPAFTFFATAGAVVNAGARPVFVDIDPVDYGLDPAGLEAAVTPRTRAVIPVHLFGQCADMEAISAWAGQAGVAVIEDAAQAIGASFRGAQAGTLGLAGCFSFFPSKNLGGFGDGGLVMTSDPDLEAQVRMLRVHGSVGEYHHAVVGYNSRLDALQAAVLRTKLLHLDSWNDARRRNAARYHERFQASGLVSEDGEAPLHTPVELSGRRHVFHQYVVRARRRDELRKFLASRGIGSAVYYPVPLHQQRCFGDLDQAGRSLPESERACEEVLALPIYPELTEDQQDEVVGAIAAFYRGVG